MKEFDVYLDLIDIDDYENREVVSDVFVYDFGGFNPVTLFDQFDVDREEAISSDCCYACIHVHHLPIYELDPTRLRARVFAAARGSLVRLGLASVAYFPRHD